MAPRDWSTIDLCQASIDYEYNNVRLRMDNADDDRNDFRPHYLALPDADILHCFSHIYYILGQLIAGQKNLIADNNSYNPRFAVPYFLKHYSGGTTFVLTWSDIITAWNAMNKPQTMQTIHTIDNMRKTIWNESLLIRFQA